MTQLSAPNLGVDGWMVLTYTKEQKYIQEHPCELVITTAVENNYVLDNLLFVVVSLSDQPTLLIPGLALKFKGAANVKNNRR